MGKKKSDIYVCFQILPYKNKANKSIFQCKFCDRQYLQNATKMESHIITQCQKVPAAIRQSYTTKPGNGGGGGVGTGSTAGSGGGALTGLNLSLMNKHSDDMDLNELIREYSDSSASEAPEQMVVNVSVPGMFRIGKSSAAGSSGGGGGGGRNNHHRQGSPSSGGGGRGGQQPPKSSPPTFGSFTGSPQNLVADFNQRSMQIRAFSQLVTGLNSLNGGGGGGGGGSNGNGGNRKRAKLDNQNNNNNNSLNNNYYTIGGAGSAHKILIKPSHGVPASKLPGGGAAGVAGARQSNGSGGIASTAATISASGGGGGGMGGGVGRGKLKPPVLLSGATITKNTASLNNNLKEKLTREETIEIWRLLARAIYSSDVPLTILENEHWINVLQRIQPSLTLPSTSVLSNALLDQEYARLGQEIEEKVEKSHFALLECVTVPGNRPDEFTLLFFLNCDDSPNPFLYKTQQVSAAYTKDNLSKIIEDVILDIGLNKVVAFMSSDISSEMEATWEVLRDKFPGLLTFACVIHGLNSVLDKILTLPEIIRMIDVIKKLYTKIEKSQELRKLVEDTLGKKHTSPFDSDPGTGTTEDKNNNLSGGIYGKFLEKWSLVGKLTKQLISEKQVYQQLLQSQPDYSRKVLDGGIDSPGGNGGGGGKSDRCLSNHLSSESFWTSLLSINSIIVPCLQWIEALHPNRQCMLSQVPEVFKELKELLQKNLRNLPVDDTTKQQVQKWFLGVQRKCVNEIHYTASLLNAGQKLRGVLTEDEEAMGMEFLTYFCDSRGYHAGEILRELAEYKGMSGGYAGEKVWKLGEVMEGEKWWEVVKGESALSNIAVSLGRVVPSCSLPQEGIVKGVGEGDEEKRERMAFIQYNLKEVGKEKMKRMEVVLVKKEMKVVPKVIPEVVTVASKVVNVPTVTVVKQEVQVAPAPAPAKIVEKLRIKIPKKPDCESPAMDLSARLSGCSQVSDEEEELSDDEDDSDEENESSTANRSSVANSSVSAAHRSNSDSNGKAANLSSSSSAAAGSAAAKPPPPHSSSNQSSDGEDGSTKDDSSSDSDDSSSDDQSD